MDGCRYCTADDWRPFVKDKLPFLSRQTEFSVRIYEGSHQNGILEVAFDDIGVTQETINYCPICGRKFEEES